VLWCAGLFEAAPEVEAISRIRQLPQAFSPRRFEREAVMANERTEQTVSGWVREAIREMKFHLEAPAARPVPTREP
jgi:hypothetical protein